MIRFTLLSIFFSVATFSLSQDCGCDYFIELEDSYFDGAAVLPGETLCIESGERERLRILNLTGTEDNPIRIQNCDGEVLINSAGGSFGMKFQNCDYFELSGAGSEGTLYGIHLIGGTNVGLFFMDLSNHFKIENVHIQNTFQYAIYQRDEPRCDLTANEGVFTLEDCEFSDLLIENCGEGITIGHPAFRVGVPFDECGVLYPYRVANLRISNVAFLDIVNGEGITLFGAEALIEDNYLNTINGSGIQLVMESNVGIYRNEIRNTNQYGVKIENGGHVECYNNVFESNGAVGTGAIWMECYTADGEEDQNSFQFIHNTILNSGAYNLEIENSELISEVSLIHNNICIAPYEVVLDSFEYAPYMSFEESDLIEVSNNLFSETAAEHAFVDVDAGDYRLTHASLGINAGATSDIDKDLLGITRNLAGQPDIGAYEYVPEPIAYFDRIPLVGLYVDDFKNILGDEDAENQLLEFARDSAFNYLILYNLSYIHTHDYDLTDPSEAIVLANFIQRAKEDYGIVQVAAVGEKNASFDKIEVFNSLFGESWFQQIDVLNLEFEFWTGVLTDVFGYYCENYLAPGGYPCTNAGAFDFYSDQLAAIDARADEMGIISEIYLGYTTDEESIELGELCDRILLHHYRTSDTYGDGSSIYNYHTYRIQAIALSERKPAVMPIFSSRSYHMGPWLMENSLHQPMQTWLYGMEGYFEDESEGVSDLSISGNVWYRYTSFLDLIEEPFFRSPNDNLESNTAVEIFQDYTKQQVVINLNVDDELQNVGHIYNLHGDLVLEFDLESNSNQIATHQLVPGMYICTVTNDNGVLRTEKFVQH